MNYEEELKKALTYLKELIIYVDSERGVSQDDEVIKFLNKHDIEIILEK